MVSGPCPSLEEQRLALEYSFGAVTKISKGKKRKQKHLLIRGEQGAFMRQYAS